MIRVLLVDDHPLVRTGVAAVLSNDDEIVVVGEAASAEEGFVEIDRLRPDIVMIDVRLPGLDGIDACESILTSHPKVKVIMLTRFPNESVMVRAFTAGAHGFLVKESDPSVVRAGVRMVADGGTFIDPSVAPRLIARATKGRRARGPYGLTQQEMRVVELLPRGLTNRDIALELNVSENTVKTHLRHAMAKLRVSDRTEAVAIAMREGLA
jgi:DNA-binding NarL/FixJ family response regulator